MSKKARVVVITAVAVVLVGAVIGAFGMVQGWGKQEPEPVAVTMPVALKPDGLPDDLRIGVILTYGSAESEGAEWNGAAQGAAVAAYRYNLGGKKVTIIAQNDGGNNDGARQAVDKLTDAGVSGIVIASSGAHVQSAISTAADAGIPTILSYTIQGVQDQSGVWTSAPSQDDLMNGLVSAISAASRPLVIEAGGTAIPTINGEQRLAFTPGSNVEDFAKEVARLAGIPADAEEAKTVAPVPNPINGIVITGDASVQGVIVAALQARNLTVPTVLTPEAASSEFMDALAKNGGTVASNLMTVGVPTSDAIALRKDESGSGMSAYLNALRSMAADKNAKNLAGDTPFADVASVADSRSHDAVIALVQAAAKAGSTEPAKVMKELGALNVSTVDGIAGPKLDFTSQFVQTGSVTTLFATGQDLGLRGVTVGQPGSVTWVSRPQN